jgi:uncharacterized protein YebE (UPF0316 family)
MPLVLEGLLFAGLIFILRVINYAISTIRLVFIARNRRFLAAALAFVEAFVFAVVMARIVSDLANALNLIAYCLGASVGSYVGMAIETRFVKSYSTVTVITQELGEAIAVRLRECGYGVTLTHGEGRDGAVDILRSSASSRDIPGMITIIRAINPHAFIEIEQARAIMRGWLPTGNAAMRQ